MPAQHENRNYWTKKGKHRQSIRITRRLQCRISERDTDANYLPIDPFDAPQFCTVNECLQAFVEFFVDWYENAAAVTCAAVSDVKTLWIITRGNHMHKGKMVGKLFAYYLVVFTVYVIDSGFWIDKKIIGILGNAVSDTQINRSAVISMGIVFSLILVSILFGETLMFSACKE